MNSMETNDTNKKIRKFIDKLAFAKQEEHSKCAFFGLKTENNDTHTERETENETNLVKMTNSNGERTA